MASPKKPCLAIIRSLMPGLEWDREYRHPGPQAEAALQYMEISEDVGHHREIEAHLQHLGYEHVWQQKRWRACRDSRYVGNFRPDLHQEDRPADEPSAPTWGNGVPHPRAATLGHFMDVALRSKGRPTRPLHLNRSRSSRDVELAHRGAPPRPGPSASSSSTVAPTFAASQGGIMACACERVCGVPCNLRAARDRAVQQNTAVD